LKAPGAELQNLHHLGLADVPIETKKQIDSQESVPGFSEILKRGMHF